MAQAQTLETIYDLIAPLNKKGIKLLAEVSFAADLEFDRLTVMDLVAEIEDEFDIILPLNLLPDLENIGQVGDAVDRIVSEG